MRRGSGCLERGDQLKRGVRNSSEAAGEERRAYVRTGRGAGCVDGKEQLSCGQVSEAVDCGLVLVQWDEHVQPLACSSTSAGPRNGSDRGAVNGEAEDGGECNDRRATIAVALLR